MVSRVAIAERAIASTERLDDDARQLIKTVNTSLR